MDIDSNKSVSLMNIEPVSMLRLAFSSEQLSCSIFGVCLFQNVHYNVRRLTTNMYSFMG